MAWTDIAKRATGYCIPKSWLDTFIDNMTYLYNALGGSGGSALNVVPNSSFENDVDADGIPDQWTQTLYTGGSASLITTDSADAKSCYKFTHPGGAGNGGGYLTSDYIAWSPYRMIPVVFKLKCSVAGIKVIGRVKFYDKDKAFLSNVDVYTSTANPLDWTLIYAKNFEVPATARFAKLELHGGVNDTDVAGDVYFDYAQVIDSEPTAGLISFDNSLINQADVATSSVTFVDVGTDHTIDVTGMTLLYVYITITPDLGIEGARYRIGTTYSSAITTDSGWCVADVSALSGSQALRFQANNGGGFSTTISCVAAAKKYAKGGRIVCDVFAGTQTKDAT